MRASGLALASITILTLTSGASLAAQQTATVARTLRVPEQFGSVQQAIDSARAGDTVLVAPGRYYENLHLRGRNIVLTSHWALSRDPAVVARTILDGSRPQRADTASVIIIDGGEDSTTVVQGFTITGGTGTVWRDPRHKILYREGGGILCEFAAPIIQHNIIENNEAVQVAASGTTEEIASAGGGGIRCGFGEPTIRQNVIRANRGRYGGGVVLFHAAAALHNNLVAGNSGGDDFGGAGVWVMGALSRTAAHLIEHNTIVGNVGVPGDSATATDLKGKASGMLILASPAAVRRNIVWNNRQPSGSQVGVSSRSLPTLEYNVVEGGLLFADGRAVPSTGTVAQDPRFIDTVAYRTRAGTSAGGEAELGAYGGPTPLLVLP
jgi:hypothetical protein